MTNPHAFSIDSERPSRRMTLPQAVRIAFSDPPGAATPISLVSRSTRPVGIAFGVMFIIFAGVAVGVIASLRPGAVRPVFDFTSFLFSAFWVLGWAIGVLILFLLTVVFLFHREFVFADRGRLVHVARVGVLRIFTEYDLAKVRGLRVDGPPRSELVRVRFDYENGNRALGNEMPREQAAHLVKTLSSTIGGQPAPESDATNGTGVHHAPHGIDLTAWLQRIAKNKQRQPECETDAAAEIDAGPEGARTSSLALLAANLIPVAGVLFLDWDLGQIMVLFWAENGVIGLYNLLKLAKVAGWGIVLIGPFFIAHYGGFMAGHFLFVYALFVGGINASGPAPPASTALSDLFHSLWPAILMLVISHGISYRTNFLGKKEYLGRDVSKQMSEPYKRIVILHVTIIFGGWVILALGSPVFALLLLVVLKTAVDLAAHRKQHILR